jgi:hypothetical protein
MPAPDSESTAQARAAIEAALSQIGFCLPGSITVLRTRCGKPRCTCTADPPSLHGPYIQWTRTVNGKTVPAAHPGPVRRLRRLVRQRPAAARAGHRTAGPVPAGDGPGRRLDQDHPRHPGAATHPPGPRPEPPQNT